jgi:tetratricopeptide (TPR) repeat protein
VYTHANTRSSSKTYSQISSWSSSEFAKCSNAIQYYDQALAIDPNNKYVLSNKGNALLYQGNYTQAIQYYDKALAIDPNYKDALNDKGNALDILGNYTQAIQYYDKALAIDPSYKDALNGKGNALNHQGNFGLNSQTSLLFQPLDLYLLQKKFP